MKFMQTFIITPSSFQQISSFDYAIKLWSIFLEFGFKTTYFLINFINFFIYNFDLNVAFSSISDNYI